MLTKPKNANSLTHTIIWDILYCYREYVQAQLNGPEINHIVCKPFSLGLRPPSGPALPGPLQRNHVINVYVATVLDHIACKGAYPAARDNPTLSVCGETHGCAGGCD
jgi:hypothetical protein